jgi:hypothetical protein
MRQPLRGPAWHGQEPWLRLLGQSQLCALAAKDNPALSVSFGVACLIIGLVYARCPITADYYDIFRLTSFALCCCPLVLAMIQGDNQG